MKSPTRAALAALFRSRRSLRVYAETAVPRRVLEGCLEAARLAPSAENRQPWRFIVLDDPALRGRVATAASGGIYLPTRFIRQAPVLIVALARTDILVNKLGTFLQGTQYYLLDLGIACQHLVLQAEAQGLGSCYIGWFSERGVRKALDLPRKYKTVCLISLGYPPAGWTAKPIKRRAPEEIVRFNETFPD
jgi:nitroreductase